MLNDPSRDQIWTTKVPQKGFLDPPETTKKTFAVILVVSLGFLR